MKDKALPCLRQTASNTLLLPSKELIVFIVKVVRLPFVSHSSFVCVLFVCRTGDE
ncbi:hypothetical protein JCM10003_3575 [Bacteroides pyogenes JCM 10003]|nr:hypothetical protein JCM10003_3575 [Bacteroides pyogenes JCM 10003]